MGKVYYTVSEIAAHFNVSRTSIYRWAELESVLINGRVKAKNIHRLSWYYLNRNKKRIEEIKQKIY